MGVRKSSSPVASRVGVVTLSKYDKTERFTYSSDFSHGGPENQYSVPKDGRSEVSAQLYQLITGYKLAAARKRVVRSIIQHVSTPPPEPPVTNRLSGSTYPLAITASTPEFKSKKSSPGYA